MPGRSVVGWVQPPAAQRSEANVTDWILHKLADRLGVAPARAGEAFSPHIRFEQPWGQTILVFTVLGSLGLIVWLYRHEARVGLASKVVLAGLRIALVLLAVFMLSEAVLSVERTGLPYLTILVDDSASQETADQYEKLEVQAALDALAAPALANPGRAGAAAQSNTEGDAAATTTRLAIAKGLILKDDARLIRDLQKQHKVRIYRVSTSAQWLAEGDRPADLEPALGKVRAPEAHGAQTRLGDGLRPGLTELRRAPPPATPLL